MLSKRLVLLFSLLVLLSLVAAQCRPAPPAAPPATEAPADQRQRLVVDPGHRRRVAGLGDA